MSLLTSSPEQHVKGLYRALEESGRLFLHEVACGADSLLGEMAENENLAAKRSGSHNQHDITDPAGLRRELEIIRREKPQNVYLSTECSASSPMQNLNQRTEQQVKDLQAKQREARKQHLAGLVIPFYARSQGSHD